MKKSRHQMAIEAELGKGAKLMSRRLMLKLSILRGALRRHKTTCFGAYSTLVHSARESILPGGHRMNDIATTGATGMEPLASLLADPDRIKDIPVDNLERLFALQREWRADRAREDFAIAFNAVQGEMRPVAKVARNVHTKSMYARAEDVTAMLDPVINKHGFSRSISTDDCPAADHMRFTLILRHVGGHEERHHLDAPVDNVGMAGNATKTRLHGMASSYTYCERHLLCKVFGVHIVSDDDGLAGAAVGPGAEKITQEQADWLNTLADELSADKIAFCKYLKINARPRARLDFNPKPHPHYTCPECDKIAPPSITGQGLPRLHISGISLDKEGLEMTAILRSRKRDAGA